MLSLGVPKQKLLPKHGVTSAYGESQSLAFLRVSRDISYSLRTHVNNVSSK